MGTATEVRVGGGGHPPTPISPHNERKGAYEHDREAMPPATALMVVLWSAKSFRLVV